MKKIGIIIVWYGKLRNYFDFWLRSVSLNPSIDFLIITDQVLPPPPIPPNVKIINLDFNELSQNIQLKFKFAISIPKPYKLCDFRPAYGHIFHDYLEKYDFWGHCDDDLIFGNIRHFITDEILTNYDKILRRGHFCLYRNTDEVNLSYLKVENPSYRKVFSSSVSYCFDETAGVGSYWYNNKKERFYDKIIFDDIDCLKFKFHAVQRKIEDSGKSNFIYSFEKGNLFRYFIDKNEVGKEEIMYVHFQKRNLAVETLPNNYFTVIPNKIIPFVNKPTVKFFKSIHSPMIYPAYFKIMKGRLKSKINKIIGNDHSN